MTIAYVLAADGPNLYGAMTRVSVASVRVTNPSARILVVCDKQTDAALTDSGDALRGEVDEWTIVDAPEGSPAFRSRFLKTRLRGHLEGPFLYLDGDTVVRGDLSDVFRLDADVAAAANHSTDEIGDQICIEDADMAARMGWVVGDRAYLNGGVMYHADTPAAARFSALWHQKWLESLAATGRSQDQPALNAAIREPPPRLVLLPHRLNAQILANPGASVGATIIHYFGSDPAIPTAGAHLARRLLDGAPLEQAQIHALLSRNHPWTSDGWVDDVVGARIARKPFLDHADRLWLQGRKADGMGLKIAGRLPLGGRVFRWARRIPNWP